MRYLTWPRFLQTALTALIFSAVALVSIYQTSQAAPAQSCSVDQIGSATLTASSTLAGSDVNNLADNLTSTFWRSEDVAPEYVTIDFHLSAPRAAGVIN